MPKMLGLMLLSALYATVLVTGAQLSRKIDPNALAPITLMAIFGVLQLIPLAWFALFPESLEAVIFSQVHPKYHRMDLVTFHYAAMVLIMTMAMIGASLGAYRPIRLPHAKSTPVNLRQYMREEEHPYAALSMFVIGWLFFLLMLHRLGGLIFLWQNLHLRVELSAGLGYLQSAYTILIFISTMYLYAFLTKKQKRLWVAMLVLSAVVPLASLGQRSPIAMLFFCLILTHHYRVRNLTTLVKPSLFLPALGLLIFMLIAVQFRSPQVSSLSDITIDRLKADVEKQLIARFGNIERGVVALGYFEEHRFWNSGLYQSVISAAIPRSVYPDKPPVDTGRYLATIAQGVSLTPPMPVHSLRGSSWPDGFYAGYMSIGIPGLLIVSFASGWFYGLVYQIVVYRGADIFSLYLFGLTGYMGAIPLSPLSIVTILTAVSFIGALTIVIGFGRFFLRRLPTKSVSPG